MAKSSRISNFLEAPLPIATKLVLLSEATESQEAPREWMSVSWQRHLEKST